MSWMHDVGAFKGGKDEWYTPPEAVKLIIKYLKPGAKVLCPFDTEDSQFVKLLTDHGFKVNFSHIATGNDFFELEKPKVDYIISNPPFSKRDAILQKLYEWQIPFGMMFNTNGLFDNRKRNKFANEYGVEIMYIYPRVKFTDLDGIQNSPPFQSCYWCYKILPEKLVFETMEET